MIREATAADKFRLVEMTTRFILTTKYTEWLDGTSPERIGKLVDMVLEHGVIFVCERVTLSAQEAHDYVAGRGDWPNAGAKELVGMLALLVFEHPLTGRLTGEEAAWWVEPEHRHSTIGPRLLHHMERWCVQNRLHMVKMVAPEGTDVGAFYAKQGYQAAETHWLRVFDGSTERDRRGLWNGSKGPA
jgi:GNAT superfamily N-acetyltransferase